MYEELLSSLAETLQTARIPYMVIGGQAVLLYGEPRLTKDIDVTLGVDTDERSKVIDAMAMIGAHPLTAADAEFVRQVAVMPCVHSQSGVRIDLIFSFSPYERSAIERGRDITVGGSSVRFAAPEDVIIHKLFAGRPRDLEDVRGMLVRKAAVEENYLLRWLGEFSGIVGRDLTAEYNEIKISITRLK